jgi:3-oxoacyl-[acyl-carrier-protein] synthase-3
MAFLRAFGRYLPERVVGNEEAGAWVGAEAEWVENVSGIRERRFAAEGETVAQMAARAGADCLARAGVSATELGMVLVSSGSGERAFPGPAAEAAKQLGCGDIPAIDLPLASAGSLFGLALAGRLAGQAGPVLVIGAEKMSRVVLREPRERGVAVLFGDGAGAALVDPEQGALAIVDSLLASDGTYAEDLKVEPERPLAMNGRSVILQASRKIPNSIRAVCARHGVEPKDVPVFLMHQANQNLIVKVAESLGVEPARFYSNIARYGNTSSASMLIAAAEYAEERGFAPGAAVVFAAFGAGFHWGALLARGCLAG